jgi:hypothetical protein
VGVIRQSTDFEEDASMHGGLTQTEKNSIIRKQVQDEMHAADGNDEHWSPHNEMDEDDHHGGHRGPGEHKTYYTTKSSGVDGIVGKLGRLEAMILA